MPKRQELPSRFFSKEMHTKALRHARLKNDLETAIQNQELFLLYQPQIDLNTKRISGFEALLRWQHRKFGKTEPGEFIHLAEERGLMHPIGEWVLHEVCRHDSLLLQNQPETLRNIGMAINVSPKQLRERFFVQNIERIISHTGISPEQLTLELTESMIMENPRAAKEVLSQIRKLGMKIAIDDFGKGYSSLSYLADFPIDIIKIDISFVHGIGKSRNHEAIIKTIISLAENLGLEVMAKGVETSSQSDFLLNHHCHVMQGYYFSRPVAHAAARELMNQQGNSADG